MTLRPRPLTAFGLVPTLIVAALCLARPSFLHRLELTAYDMVLRAAPLRAPGGRVVIVDVDDKSLTAVGQWPWRRDLVGDLITRIRDAGAAVVALDVIFAEPDRFDADGPARDALSADDLLARTLGQGRVVLGYGMKFDEPATDPGGCIQHPLPLAVLSNGDVAAAPYFSATGVICSLPRLASAAGASGFLNAAPDPDGILRRAPLLMELRGRVYPSIGVAAVTAIERARNLTLRVENANTSMLMASTDTSHQQRWSVPLDGRSNLLLRYRGRKRTFTYASAVDVLEGRVSPGVFRNKLVLVGTTALGNREVVSTPLDTLFTGVEVQATIADNLLQRDFISRPSGGILVETLVVVLLGAI